MGEARSCQPSPISLTWHISIPPHKATYVWGLIYTLFLQKKNKKTKNKNKTKKNNGRFEKIIFLAPMIQLKNSCWCKGL